MKLDHLEGAEEDFAEGLRALWTVQDLVNLPIALMIAAALAAHRGDPVRAGTLWGAAEREAEREPRPTTLEEIEKYESHLEPVLGETFEDSRAHGRTLSLEEAVAYALDGQT
jgi:hypothetical protein